MRRIICKNCQIGDERIIRRFLFFPRIIGDEKRWLEKARIFQIYKEYMTISTGGAVQLASGWVDCAWVDD